MKQLNTSIIFLSILFIGISTKAQLKLKAYGNVDVNNSILLNQQIDSNNYYQAYFDKPVFFSFALHKSTDNKYKEFEISKIIFDRNSQLSYMHSNTIPYQFVSGNKVGVIQLAVRLEKGKRFFTNKKFSASYGIGLQPYYNAIRNMPYTTFNFPVKYASAGLVCNIVPRINYYIANKLSIDFNIPLQMLDINMTIVNTQNPAIGQTQRKKSQFNFDTPFMNKLFPFRLGLAYTI